MYFYCIRPGPPIFFGNTKTIYFAIELHSPKTSHLQYHQCFHYSWLIKKWMKWQKPHSNDDKQGTAELVSISLSWDIFAYIIWPSHRCMGYQPPHYSACRYAINNWACLITVFNGINLIGIVNWHCSDAVTFDRIASIINLFRWIEIVILV